MVPERRGLPGLPRLVAVASRLPLHALRLGEGLATACRRSACGGCRKRVRVLAGTIFKDIRTPLTVWFEAAWLMTVIKNGVSAASLRPLLGLGSNETARAMCTKLRNAMGRTSTDLRSGEVEVDETYVGGVKSGESCDRGAPGRAW